MKSIIPRIDSLCRHSSPASFIPRHSSPASSHSSPVSIPCAILMTFTPRTNRRTGDSERTRQKTSNRSNDIKYGHENVNRTSLYKPSLCRHRGTWLGNRGPGKPLRGPAPPRPARRSVEEEVHEVVGGALLRLRQRHRPRPRQRSRRGAARSLHLHTDASVPCGPHAWLARDSGAASSTDARPHRRPGRRPRQRRFSDALGPGGEGGGKRGEGGGAKGTVRGGGEDGKTRGGGGGRGGMHPQRGWGGGSIRSRGLRADKQIMARGA